MPYSIKRKGNCYEVYNRETGEVKAECTTMAKAMSQVRLLHGVSHGMVPRRNPSENQWFIVQMVLDKPVDLIGPFSGEEAVDQFLRDSDNYFSKENAVVLIGMKSPDEFSAKMNLGRQMVRRLRRR